MARKAFSGGKKLHGKEPMSWQTLVPGKGQAPIANPCVFSAGEVLFQKSSSDMNTTSSMSKEVSILNSLWLNTVSNISHARASTRYSPLRIELLLDFMRVRLVQMRAVT